MRGGRADRSSPGAFVASAARSGRGGEIKTILVTGATGILGSNVCALLIEKGYGARAIARDMAAADVNSLKDAGVEVVPGDVTDLASMRRATEAVDSVVHCAAMLGRPGSSWDGSWSTNVLGTIHVLTAAAQAGDVPVVQVLTTTFFNQGNGPLTERSPLDVYFHNNDMYSTTKRLAYVEGVARVAEGQDVRFMIPGAIYGPTICVEKGMASSTFNDRIVKAIRGQMPSCLPLPIPWVTAKDCAYVCIAALEKGARGERYIAHGVPGEAGTLAVVLNQVCAMAGSAHRVQEISKNELDSPEIFARFGPTMPMLARKTYFMPMSDSSFTEKRLGYVPTPLAQGFSETLAWMRHMKVL
jgi:dihydroflavonol-4-reductase